MTETGWMNETLKAAGKRIDELPIWAGGTGGLVEGLRKALTEERALSEKLAAALRGGSHVEQYQALVAYQKCRLENQRRLV